MGKARKFLGYDNVSRHSEQRGINRGINTNILFQSNPKPTSITKPTTTYLKKEGGMMTGPIGFVSESIQILSNNLDITYDGTNNVKVRKNIFISVESGTADTIDTIEMDAKEMEGQELRIIGTNAGHTYTITHDSATSGNKRAILTPTANSIVITGKASLDLFFDQTVNKWVVVGSGGGDRIEQGNSKVQVVDAGTGAISFYVDDIVTPRMSLDATELLMYEDIDMQNNFIVNVQDVIFDGGTSQRITADGTGMKCIVDNTNLFDIQDAGGSVWTVDTGGKLGQGEDEFVYKAASGFNAFMCGGTAPGTMTNAANVGALQIPYKADNTDSPSSTTLNNWFGDQNGCIGLQFDDDVVDTFRLWAKLNGTWHSVNLT